MIPSLDIRDAIALITGIITITGAYFAVKGGQKESERLLKALHTRFDVLEKEVSNVKLDHAVLVERVKNLKETGRFRLAKSGEIIQAPLFKGEEE